VCQGHSAKPNKHSAYGTHLKNYRQSQLCRVFFSGTRQSFAVCQMALGKKKAAVTGDETVTERLPSA
jgi:hypothetical protein